MEKLTLEGAISHLDDILINKVWSCSECMNEHIALRSWLNELKQYKDLEEQGKLLKLPCKVGDTVYTIYSDEDGSFIEEPKVVEISTHRIWIARMYFDYDDFGKTVFLTQAEAEAALENLFS